MTNIPAVQPTTDNRALGGMLVGASALAYALAGAMTKSVDADPFVITGWRGLVGGLLIAAYVQFRAGARRADWSLGWRGWSIAVTGATASLAFISAFKYGYVANAAVIYATSPFVAALFGWLLLGERLRGLTLGAAAVSLAGVAFMVKASLGSGVVLGDLYGVAMAVFSALYMVLIRKFRDTPVVWAGAVSGFLLFSLSWVISDPMAVSAPDMGMLVLFGVAFAGATILWTEGARLIPSSEAGLIGSAEVPFAVLFAWIFIAETPPAASLIGGAIVLCAVIAHAAIDWRQSRRTAA